MTYSASTSLSVLIYSISPSQKGPAVKDLMNVIQNGMGVSEGCVVFGVSPVGGVRRREEELKGNEGVGEGGGSVEGVTAAGNGGKWEAVMEGDVYEVRSTSLDASMWKLGGASVALGLVQYAKVSSIFPVVRLGYLKESTG